MKKVLVIVDAGPYGTATAAEAYRVLQGLGGMGIETTCLLLGDGAFIALKNQKPEEIEMQSLERAYPSLKEFAVKIFVLEESLKERGIKEEDLIQIEGILKAESARELMDEHHCVINFTSGS
ncbi:MAG: DsrE family protein [Caldiserica bacterium]|jgi:sulfur relay protein TusC/DsrF|nr:DsrE family protein [Caldisericota bacterium]MDH7562653.1 DsrE family protein [Caldisericota bacterium]